MPPIRRTGKPEQQRPTRRTVAGRGPARPASDGVDLTKNGSERIPGGRDRVPGGDGRSQREQATTDAATATDAAATTGPATDTDSTSGPSAGGRWFHPTTAAGGPRRVPRPALLGAVLAVLGLAAGVYGTAVVVDPGRDALGRAGVDDRAFVDQAATDEVVTAATADVQRLVSIDHATLDAYHASLGEFLAPNLVTELDKSWPTLKDTYEQSKMKVDAQVGDVGVSFLSADRAEVLVVQDVSTSRDGQATGSTTGTYLITLAKTDGTWKLSEIPDLPS